MSNQSCPCGLARELVVAGNLHDSAGICTAIDANGNPCGKRLADHPSQYEVTAPHNNRSHALFGGIPVPAHHQQRPDYHLYETHQYHLENVNGSMTGLREYQGFRQYIAQRMRQIGVKGFIKRVPRDHAKLVVTGIHTQLEEIENFLHEIEDEGMIEGHFLEKPEMIPISKTFKVLSSDRKFVLTGSYSNSALDQLVGHNQANDPILREPSER